MWVETLTALRASDVGSPLHKNPSGTLVRFVLVFSVSIKVRLNEQEHKMKATAFVRARLM